MSSAPSGASATYCSGRERSSFLDWLMSSPAESQPPSPATLRDSARLNLPRRRVTATPEGLSVAEVETGDDFVRFLARMYVNPPASHDGRRAASAGLCFPELLESLGPRRGDGHP